jgi:hypothetical protein
MRQNRRLIPHVLKHILLSIPILGLSGCYNYPEVASLSSAMQTSVTNIGPFADDISATCTRKLSYDTLPDTDGTCAHLATVQQETGKRITVLDNYFGALAAVAVDSNFIFDDGLGAIGASVTQVGANAADVSAVQAIATTLANLVGAKMRLSAMKKLIDQAPNAVIVVAGLQDIFDKTYGSNLDREAKQWQLSMEFAAGRLNIAGPPACAVTGTQWTTPKISLSNIEQVRFQRFYSGQCAIIMGRRAALAKFDTASQQIQKSLSDLNSKKTRLSDKSVLQAFATQAKTIFEQAQAVKKAFGTTNV